MRASRAATLLSRPVLEAAADWHVRLNFDGADQRAEAEAAHRQWLATSEQHRSAWALVQRMEQQLGLLPQGSSRAALADARQRRMHRRTVLKSLVLLAGGAGLGWNAYDVTPWRSWVADYRTAPGERRQIALADGGRVDLNTTTALDVHYDADLRLLRLHDGEILVQTAPDHRAAARLFIVDTPHGRIRALGTRFDVRVDGEATRIAVYEHAVAISTRDSDHTLLLDAGESTTFTRNTIAAKSVADSSQSAWTRGMLVAVDQRLDEFLQELSRYRRGRIDCDPAIASLRVTGAYRLDDIDHVLQSLALSHPLRIRHFTRLWTRVAGLE